MIFYLVSGLIIVGILAFLLRTAKVSPKISKRIFNKYSRKERERIVNKYKSHPDYNSSISNDSSQFYPFLLTVGALSMMDSNSKTIESSSHHSNGYDYSSPSHSNSYDSSHSHHDSSSSSSYDSSSSSSYDSSSSSSFDCGSSSGSDCGSSSF